MNKGKNPRTVYQKALAAWKLRPEIKVEAMVMEMLDYIYNDFKDKGLSTVLEAYDIAIESLCKELPGVGYETWKQGGEHYDAAISKLKANMKRFEEGQSSR